MKTPEEFLESKGVKLHGKNKFIYLAMTHEMTDYAKYYHKEMLSKRKDK